MIERSGRTRRTRETKWVGNFRSSQSLCHHVAEILGGRRPLMKPNLYLAAGMAMTLVMAAPALAQDMHPSSGMGRDTSHPAMGSPGQPGIGGNQGMPMHDQSNNGPMGGRSPSMSGDGVGDRMDHQMSHVDMRGRPMHRHCRMVRQHGHRVRRCM